MSASWDFTYFTKVTHHDTYPEIDPTQDKLSAAGKHVVVTGGGTGIGKSIALSFARAGAASVAIMSRRRAVLEDTTKEIAAAGPNTHVVFATADATDRISLDAAFKSIANQTGGRIDVLVSHAGGLPSPGTVAEADVKALTQGFEMNVASSFNTFQAFLPYAAKDAQIFNTSSGIGHILPTPGVFNYAMTKAAGIKLFEYIALEHPDFHVVSVQPGVIATEMNVGFQEDSLDTRNYRLLKPCFSSFVLTVECSGTTRPFLCLAGFSGGRVSQEQVRLGELGCQGASYQGGGNQGE